MGRGDGTLKMRRIRAQKKKNERIKRRIEAAKAAAKPKKR
jgi:hypothetical protein